MSDATFDAIAQEVEPRTAAFAAIALLVVSILAGVLYWIKPTYQEYASVRAEHAQAVAGAAGSGPDGTVAAIATAEREVERLRDELYGGAANVPRNQLESFVVDALDRSAGRHGVKLLGITPDEPSRVWLFEELPYSVAAQGPYRSIHHWLHHVERDLRPMVVKQFRLSRARETGQVLIDFRVVAYRADQERAS